MKTSNILKLIDRISKAAYVTQSLIEKSQQFAEFMDEQMDNLGVNNLMSGKYSLITLTASAGSDTSLYMRYTCNFTCENLYVRLNTSEIDSQRDTRLLYGDFNASYNLPNRNDILNFLSDAEELLKELANLSNDIETPLIDIILNLSKEGDKNV